MISIHAPRVGSDYFGVSIDYLVGNFNPRSPCGERPIGRYKATGIVVISIHAPRVGSDPGCACHASHGCFISIHAPRVGSD